MRKQFHYLIAFFVAMLITVSGGFAQKYKVKKGDRPPIELDKISPDAYESGFIQIKIKPQISKAFKNDLIEAERGQTVITGIESLDVLNKKYVATTYQPLLYNLYKVSPVSNKFRARHEAWGFHLWYIVKIDEKADIKQVVKEFQSLDEVEYAEPIYKKRLVDGYSPEKNINFNLNSKWTPNDADYGDQWHYNNTGQTGGTPDCDIDLPEAWDIETGHSDVIVAVMDEGIQYDHPDIAANMWPTIGPEGTGTAPGDHGTHVGGTIAAVSNNGTGVSGVAGGSGSGDGVRLMSLDLFNGPLNTTEMNVYAADNGAAISQNSWGYGSAGTYNQTDIDGIDYFNANGGGSVLNGGITIFAAGNDDDNGDWWPGYYDQAMSVAATNHDDQKSWYSNYGTWVHISAPGGETTVTAEGVLSTVSGGGYDWYQGTSMACPHVSGVAALITSLAHRNGLTLSNSEVWDILVNTTDDHYAVNGTYTGELGTGRLNAFQALQETQNMLSGVLNPQAFNATAVSTSQIDLDWTKNGDNDDVMIAYSLTNTFGTPTDGTSYSVGNTLTGGGEIIYKGSLTSFAHTGLNSSTTYYYKIWSYDGTTVYSSGRTANATTFCDAFTAFPLTEGFESGNLPTCWSYEGTSWAYQDGGHDGNPANAHSGSFNALFYHGSSTADVSKLVTRQLDFSGYTDATLTFWHTQAAWAGDQDELRVYYKTASGGTWNLLTEYTGNITGWTEETITLPNLTSDYYVAFEATGQYGYGVAIDDVGITATSSCTPPTTQASNFGSSAIGDNQMTISWTRGNGDAVVVLAKEGSAVDGIPSTGINYADNAIFGNGDEIGTGNFVVYDGTASNATVTGLNLGTTYHFAVFEYFTADDCYNTTALTGSETTTGTPPCTPCNDITSATDDATGVTLVDFNTINNASLGDPEYTDNTAQSTDITYGETHNLTVNVNTAGDWLVNTTAWIDWNQNCDFTDDGEEYILGTAQNVTDGATSESPLAISVPFDAPTGSITMRVRASYSDGTIDPLPCGNQDWSEAEDYTINLVYPTGPTILTSESSIDFGQVGLGFFSEQSYEVYGYNLTNDITVTAPADFEISLTSGTGFTNSLTIPQTSGSVDGVTVFVKFSPGAEQTYTGNVTHTSTGATQVDVALTGEGVNWLPSPINLVGTLNGVDADLTWDPPATNNSPSNWYDYVDVANSTSFVDNNYIIRGSLYEAADLGYTYPIKVTQLRHAFIDFGTYGGGAAEWTDATFKFVIYAEDLTTLLYESPEIEAVHNDPFDYVTHTIPNGIILTGDFFMGIETVAADGFPSSLLAPITGTDYHSYVYDGNTSSWGYFADIDFSQGFYIDGAKGSQYIGSENNINTNNIASNINAKPIKLDSPVITNNNATPKSALTGYIVYRDGVDISGQLPATQTTYTDANICGLHTYSVTATYSGYDGESLPSNTDNVENPLPTAPTGVTATSTSICAATNTTLSFTGGSGDTFVWYTGSCGGTQVGTGNNLTVSPSVETTYFGRWENDCGESTCMSITISINPATAIGTQPTDETACVGDNVTFSMSATGSNVTYQWYKGATAITGATSDTYTINGVDATDAANYYCEVVGDCGTVSTDVVSLTITPATVIGTQPTDETACAGDNVTFSVSATGSGITYQWYKGATAITGATSASYTLSGVSAADAANYYCQVSGDCGDVSSDVVSLTITPATAISTQPTNQTACEGDNVTLSLSATGSNVTYQWKKGGVNISGATSNSYTINGVTELDEATYTCLVSGDCGDVTSTAVTLTVNPATAITDQSADQTACVGSDVSFFVTADGSGLSYQWYKDGSTIGGETGSTLNLTSVDATDEGDYTCQVTGDCGTVTTVVASLTITAGLTLGDPADANVCPTETATFTVVANGTNLSFQWKKDGTNLTNGGDISGATSETLTISNVSAADVANYTCFVTSDCGDATSIAASLILNDETAISTQPAGGDFCVGKNLNLSVSATGTNLTYQWYKDAVSISGATSSTYTISGLTAGDAGSFTCDVIGDCSTVTSAQAVVNILDETAISTQPSNVEVCEGSTAEFTVAATGSSLTYEWFLDGTTSVGNSATLSFTASSTNTGDYTCVVTGDCGTVTSSVATLSLTPATEITTEPANADVCEGSNATFEVIASGEGLTYQWYFAGSPIGGATSNSYVVVNTTPADEGDYYCEVSGTCGTVTSATASLLIGAGVTINAEPQNVDACEGADATFTVEATGDNLTYQWYFAGSPISGAESSSYTVYGVSATDEGSYYCEITGDCGAVTSASATLTIGAGVTITSDLTNLDVCEGADATFTVEATGDNLTYQWYFAGSPISGAEANSYTVSGVTATDEGEYYCEITGDCGTVTSATATLIIGPGVTITAEPESVAVCDGSDATFTVDATGDNLTYQWYFEGTAISGAEANSYTVSGATATNEGSYYCEITGDCGTVTTATVTLSISGDVSIITEPVDVEVSEGADAVFTVVANGTSVAYQWRKDGTNLTDGANVSGSQTDMLTISAVTYDDEATYDVVVSGDCNDVTSNGAVLTISVSVTELQEFGINVYPNPTNGLIKIEYSKAISVDLTITDINGRTLFNAKEANNTVSHIDLSNYSAGVYFFRFTTEGKTIVTQIIVQ